MTKTKKARGIDGDSFLAAQFSDPRVRHHFEQRRIVHEVAVAVRGMRMGAGLTQAQLATRIGTSQPTIARLEKGLDVRTPRWDTLQRIARALGRQLKLKFAAPSDDDELVEVEQPLPAAKEPRHCRARSCRAHPSFRRSSSPRLAPGADRTQRIAAESRSPPAVLRPGQTAKEAAVARFPRFMPQAVLDHLAHLRTGVRLVIARPVRRHLTDSLGAPSHASWME